MRVSLAIILVTYLTPVLLSLLYQNATKNSTDDVYHFCMRPTKAVVIVGIVGTGLFAALIAMSYLGGQFKGAVAAVFVTLMFMGIITILSPLKGFWDITVDGNEMTTSRLWFIKKHYEITNISFCQYVSGGIRVVFKNTDELKIETIIYTNVQTFEKRMEKEGIELVSFSGY